MTEDAFNRWTETLPDGRIVIIGWDVTREQAQRIKQELAVLDRPGLVTEGHDGQPRIDTSQLTPTELEMLRRNVQTFTGRRVVEVER